MTEIKEPVKDGCKYPIEDLNLLISALKEVKIDHKI